jgi:hypothetical protein
MLALHILDHFEVITFSAHLDMANHQTDRFSLNTKCRYSTWDKTTSSIIRMHELSHCTFFKSHNRPKINYHSMPSILLDEFQHAHLCGEEPQSLSLDEFRSPSKTLHADASSLRKFENKTHTSWETESARAERGHSTPASAFWYLFCKK